MCVCCSVCPAAVLQVRANLFGPVVHGLSECAALRYVTPDDPLWQQAAGGLTSIIQAGLPAVNIMFVNNAQQPNNAWQVLADTFETFLLGEGLPEGLVPAAAVQQERQPGGQQQQQPSRALQHSSSDADNGGGPGGSAQSFRKQLSHSATSMSSRAAGAAAVDSPAEAALQRAVLDILTEQVLTSCSSAAHEQRSRLVRVLVVGSASTTMGHTASCSSSSSSISKSPVTAAATAGADTDGTSTAPAGAGAAATTADGVACVAADQRFSQLCLRRLALLASRGTDGQAGSMSAVLLEVAQLALPQLVERCRVVLQAYAQLEQAAAAEELQQLQHSVQQQRQRQHAEAQISPRPQQPQQQQPEQQQEQQDAELISQADCAVADVLTEEHKQQQQEQPGDTTLSQLQQQCLVEEALCVLQVVLDLQLDAAVFDHLLEQQSSVAACLAAVQHAQQVHEHMMQQQQQPAELLTSQHQPQHQQQQHSPRQKQQQHQSPLQLAQDPQSRLRGGHSHIGVEQGPTGSSETSSSSTSRHQGHLLLLYKELAQCAGCRDRRVGVLVRAALQAAGRQLAL